MFIEEEKTKVALEKEFPSLAGGVQVKRARRVFAQVPYEIFHKVFKSCVESFGYKILLTMTGLDEGEKLGVLYHVAREDGIVLTLHTTVDKSNPQLNTISAIFPAADIYERELVDLLGFKVLGLAEGYRYPLPDKWPAGEYPLRKDWKGAEALPDVKTEGGENE